MDKKEFLDTLRQTLLGEVPESEILNNVRYYDEYITDNDKLEQLGDSRLIARTIIETYKMSKASQYKRNTSNNKEGYQDADYGYNYEKYEKQAEENEDEYDNRTFSNNNNITIPWYYKILGVILLVLFLVIVVAVGGILLNALFYFAIPIIIITFLTKTIIHMIKKR